MNFGTMKNSTISENKSECTLSDRKNSDSVNSRTFSSTDKNVQCSFLDEQHFNKFGIFNLKDNKIKMENIKKKSKKAVLGSEKNSEILNNPENPVTTTTKEEQSSINDNSSENIVAMQQNTEYFEGVIIMEKSIKFKSIESKADIEINSKVSFTLRESSRRIQGTVIWVGKINEVDACEVEVKDKADEDILKWRITEASTNATEPDQFRLYVASHAIKKDVLTYLTCKNTGLSIIDPKSIDSVKNIGDFKGIWIIFVVNSKNMIAELKWKGQINAKLCIGIKLICDSEHGTSGTFGCRELFKCDPRKGVLVSIDKIKTCNLKDHNKLVGNDFRSLCCIESLNVLPHNSKFQVGCRVYDKSRNINGTCSFIGKANGEDVIGIKTKQMTIDHNMDVLHYINQKELNIENCVFVLSRNVEIQSFYQTLEPVKDDKYFKALEIDSRVKYYPDRSKHDEFQFGMVKWLGFNDEQKYLCGIDLDEELPSDAIQYYLDKDLFSYKEKCGVIDEIYKVELAISETETGHDNQNETIAKLLKLILERLKYMTLKEITNEDNEKDIIDCLSLITDDNLLNQFFQDASHIISNQFSLFSKFHNKLDEDIMKSHLGQRHMSDNDLVNNKGTLESCKQQSKYDYLYIILCSMTIESSNDALNSIILDLALSCVRANDFDFCKKFLDKCENKNCLLNGTETFITAMLKDLEKNEISKDGIIKVLKMKIFDINQENLAKETPIELAVKSVDCDIVRVMLDIIEIKINSKELTELLISRRSDKADEALKLYQMIKDSVGLS